MIHPVARVVLASFLAAAPAFAADAPAPPPKFRSQN